eukprot:2632137-Amphidinium_carterae.1
MWLTFVTNWLRPLGRPSEMRCDNGPEFQHDWLYELETAGIAVHMNPRLYPQANGIAERHGGFYKYIAQAAMLDCEYVFRLDDKEQPLLTSPVHGEPMREGLIQFLADVQHTANNYLHEGGYTASQLAFGQAQRLPVSLQESGSQISAASRATHERDFRERFYYLSAVRRAAASAQSSSKLGKVMSGRPRSNISVESADVAPGMEVGSQVFVYMHPSPRKRGKRWWYERWVGPCL